METKLLNPPFSQLWPRELHRYFKLIRVTVNKRRGAYTRPGSKRADKFKLGLQSGSEKTKRGPAHLSTFTLDLAWMRGRAIPQDKRGEHLPDLASVPDCLLLPEVGGWFSSSQTKLAQKPQLCLFRLLYVVVPSNICVPCTFFKKTPTTLHLLTFLLTAAPSVGSRSSLTQNKGEKQKLILTDSTLSLINLKRVIVESLAVAGGSFFLVARSSRSCTLGD